MRLSTTLLAVMVSMTASVNQASEKGCMIRFEDLSQLNSIECGEGDYLTIWDKGLARRSETLLIRAAMMQVCDLSKPYSIESSANTGLELGTCVLSGKRRSLSADKESQKQVD